MMPASQRSPLALTALFLWVLAVLLAKLTGASTYLPISDTTLSESARVIVEGRISAAESAPQKRPAIDYLIEVERLIKGPLTNDSIVLRVPGGVRPDGIGLLLRGAPRFHVGDDVLLFLDPRKDGTFGLHQFMLGAFRIEMDGDVRIARRDLTGALRLSSALKQPEDFSSESDVRDADRFRRWLIERAAGRVSKSDYFLPADEAADPPDGTGAFRTIISPDDPPPFGCGEDGGHSVRWFEWNDPETARDVGWRTHFSGQSGVPGGGIGAFARSLAAWTDDPNTPIRYVYDGLTVADGGLSVNDGLNVLLFDDPNDEISGTFNGEGLLALGGPWFDCETLTHQGQEFHPIFGADIVTQDGLELFFNSTPDAANAAEQLFAHELGHTLGLAHSEDAGALMRGLFHPDTRGAALDVDDLAGAFYLYGHGDLSPPMAPSQLTAFEEMDGSVLLEWEDNSDNESVFRVERQHSGEFELVSNATAEATSFIDTGIMPSTLYSYRLRAQNASGASAYSNVATLMTSEDRRPDAPSNLRAAPLSSTEIRLTWQDNSDDETGFILEILIPPVWAEIPFELPPDITKVIVAGLPPASTQSFRVRAVNAYGASAASNQATAETFADDFDCLVTADELCLLGGRFKVSVAYRNQHNRGAEGNATVVPSTDETGTFWFFSPDNVELIVKALDGRYINQHFWLFYGALTDIEYTINLTDTVTGAVKSYHNPPGEICGLADTTAFLDVPGALAPAVSHQQPAGSLEFDSIEQLELLPVPETPAAPGVKSGSCQPGGQTLCLLNDRLSVEVWWRNPHDDMAEGPGRAIVDSDSTGMFWFFNIENTELVVKALDGSALNQHLWLFYGALTDLEYWITVTDTVAGDSRVYYNPPGEVCGRADIRAFEADPSQSRQEILPGDAGVE